MGLSLKREQLARELKAAGMTTDEIAVRLKRARSTVQSYFEPGNSFSEEPLGAMSISDIEACDLHKEDLERAYPGRKEPPKAPYGTMRFVGIVATALAMLAWGVQRPAVAHQAWADGTVIPRWIKSACCGPADSHLLNDSQVHMLSDGIHIDGIKTVVPYDKVLPSMDGQIWAFWPNNGAIDPPVYCFFFSGSI